MGATRVDLAIRALSVVQIANERKYIESQLRYGAEGSLAELRRARDNDLAIEQERRKRLVEKAQQEGGP